MSEPVSAGEIVAGKYRVDRVIGQGAMGLVVAATHVALGRRVALKFMLGGGAGVKGREERFLREARAASMLQTQHVGKVLDVGTLDTPVAKPLPDLRAGYLRRCRILHEVVDRVRADAL